MPDNPSLNSWSTGDPVPKAAGLVAVAGHVGEAPGASVQAKSLPGNEAL
jgi:hypothetical protein